MQKENSNQQPELFYYCFYNVYSLKHVNYHHVIMRMTLDGLELVQSLDADNYQYRLISATPVFLEENDLELVIIRGLVMDGESLLKRFIAQHKKNPFSTLIQSESS